MYPLQVLNRHTSVTAIKMSVDLDLKYLENSNKGIYLLGINITEVWGHCEGDEEIAQLIEVVFDQMIEILEGLNKITFPKRGIGNLILPSKHGRIS